MEILASGNSAVARFIKELQWEDIPREVQEHVKYCALDVLGAIIAGSATRIGQIISEHAETQWQGREATILLMGKKASISGAALANSFMANALDIDDGYRNVKGHPGGVVFPATLAAAEKLGVTGKEFLTALVIGYEVAIRAGLAWHDYHAEYHGSGSWGALGAAAGAARMLSLSEEQIAHALGTAEYHAPIVPMMRCIDYPAMTKDGIGWGSMVGAASALLAGRGFTAIHSLLGIEKYQALVDSLGKKYELLNLYFKPYSCCRWAQPAVSGALQLRDKYGFRPEDIERVKVFTFAAATRLGITKPGDTEQAQYSMAYPIAAALVDGEVGPGQVLEDKLANPAILKILKKVEVSFAEELEREFPARCLCDVEIVLNGGKSYRSGPVIALGDPDNPLSLRELKEKFRWLAGYVLEPDRVDKLTQKLMNLEHEQNIKTLPRLLARFKE